MSRVGRAPIDIPSGVKVKVDKRSVSVQKGDDSLVHLLPRGIDCTITDKQVTFTRQNDDRRLRSLHGLTRALVANAVRGVNEGFKRDLEIVGIGYKAQLEGKTLHLALGYSHPVDYPIPEGIEIKVDKLVRLSVSGIDRQKVGQVAAEIRAFRPPEPYKGKGIRYAGETVKRKAGKAGKAAGA